MAKLTINIELGREDATRLEHGAVVLLIPAFPEEYKAFAGQVAGVHEFLMKLPAELERLNAAAAGELSEQEVTRFAQHQDVAAMVNQAFGEVCLMLGRIVVANATQPDGKIGSTERPEDQRRKSDERARDGLAKHLGIKPMGRVQ